jgi:hypothetical protein
VVTVVCIEAAAVPVRSADQEAAARFGDRWAMAQHEDRPAEPLCVDRLAVALPWVRPAMLPCVGLRATSRSVMPGHTRTFIVGRTRTFTVVPIPIMEPVLSRQALSSALLLVPQQPPHTTTRTTRSPIIRLPVDRHIRRIRPPAQTPIEIILVSAEP